MQLRPDTWQFWQDVGNALALCEELETLHLSAPGSIAPTRYTIDLRPIPRSVSTTLTPSFSTFNRLWALMLSRVPPSVREITLELRTLNGTIEFWDLGAVDGLLARKTHPLLTRLTVQADLLPLRLEGTETLEEKVFRLLPKLSATGLLRVAFRLGERR